MAPKEKLLMLARALAAYSVRKHISQIIKIEQKYYEKLIVAKTEEERARIQKSYARALKRLIRQLTKNG